ncbi:alkaline ceramidase [Bremerella sp. JC770]|uniref:alkaline ceramidase n=1 Tax=Bremerella sp. JC770 TaxID=3232137 RepID=UPI003457C32B
MSNIHAENTSFRHPAWSGEIGIATLDITPPVGIYARCWGASSYDTADQIHRRLTLNVLVLRSQPQEAPVVLVDGDLPWWQTIETFTNIQSSVLGEFSLPKENFWLAVSHTHAAPPLVEVDPSAAGAKLHAAWLDRLRQSILSGIHQALQHTFSGTIDWKLGKCDLAANRDFPDPDDPRILCGFNPDGTADDTLLIGRITDQARQTRGVIVNYACHPTTLAWENRAISPDFLGAMREHIESLEGVTPFFLQGASGELAPRHQYVADTSVADRHGKQLAYAVLSTLHAMEPPGQQLEYRRVTESGAPLAVWQHAPSHSNPKLSAAHTTVSLPLKHWPTAAEFDRQRVACIDRALQERLRRKRDIRRTLGDGESFELSLWAWRLGDVVWVGTMAEAYSELQTELRRRFPGTTIVCMNLLNGSIGYLPPASAYHLDLYPVTQTPFGEGCLELTIDALTELVEQLLAKPASSVPGPFVSAR